MSVVLTCIALVNLIAGNTREAMLAAAPLGVALVLAVAHTIWLGKADDK